jgi:pyruvate,orthophosphate dikinase
MTQWVYQFGNQTADGNASMKNLLGGKGANLAEMASIGLPVPSGFTITTEVCTYFYDNNQSYPSDLRDQVKQALKAIEENQGSIFGNIDNPLLVSVRSGARVSMPGMMDTVLNLGLNDQTVEGLAKKSGDERFAWDSYRRFIQMYADVVMGYDHHEFEDVIDTLKRRKGYIHDTDMTAEDWKSVITDYKSIVNNFPQDPFEQLWGAIGAVFSSWQIPRAVTYRKINNIPHNWGTAVNVQAMVFGNMGLTSGTGVAFTRDPSTGENYFYGEYLINAQGEDVVAGIRTPLPIDDLKTTMPAIYDQLSAVRLKLENHYRDMQDIEFTIQQGKLYMLQTRSGKRTAKAALKIAVDMVSEGVITKDEAILRVDPSSLDQLLHPTLDPDAKRDVLTTGLPASPGAATGAIAFSADLAEEWANNGTDTILCRIETSPEDIHGMHAAQGILTSRGGMTSHAAVVARGMGRCCVAGAGAITMDYKSKTLTVNDRVFNEGDVITLDGGTGEVIAGAIARVEPELSGDFETVMAWADNVRTMGVRANAETRMDARTARNFGAEGIGLARTEHMFFDAGRIQKVREMIFASDTAGRVAALNDLEPMQKGDFIEVFEAMDGLPVTVRLLDPPLHEFLPHNDKDIAEFASSAGVDEKIVRDRLNQLHESNPMLGHRGCRLGITFPEIYACQVRAIIEAALETNAKPEIMIPLIATSTELKILRDLTEQTAEGIFEKHGKRIEYLIGTMIELPRAALMASDIAAHADFFSFGTNDLTQTALGLSRDDAGKFLPDYVDQGILPHDPFVTLDRDGVGRLVDIAYREGRDAKPNLKLGICGEHGGDPASIEFCQQVGLDYVSCSPYRVPIARLAAAQAALRFGQAREDKADPIAA